MKKLIHAFFMCLSMFTRIPAIYNKWDEEAKPYMLMFLPVVGGIIGGLWFGLAYFLTYIDCPIVLKAFCLTIFIYLITGFIHFDGYMDVIDATHSYRDLEERRRILKDSHVGSFAVIYAIMTVLASFVFFLSLPRDVNYISLIFIPVFSRILSGLEVTIFKPMNTSQYNLEESKKLKVIKIIYFVALAILLLALEFIVSDYKVLVGLSVIVVHFVSCLIARNSLKGMNGDISGYAIIISESLAILVMMFV